MKPRFVAWACEDRVPLLVVLPGLAITIVRIRQGGKDATASAGTPRALFQ